MSRKSVIALIVLVLVFFIIQLRMPKKWDWTPTWSPTDNNPFGCLLMDSVLKGSLPHGRYKVARTTLWQLAHSRDSLSNVLWVTETATLDVSTTRIIRRMMARGQRVMIVAGETRFMAIDNTRYDRQWGIAIRMGDRFTVADVLNLRQSHTEMDTVAWKDSLGHAVRKYQVLRPMTNNVIDLADGNEGKQWKPIITSRGYVVEGDRDPYVYAARRRFGRGEIVVVTCTPCSS